MQNQKRVLFSNFLSLSALQIVNYILPLVTLPYLVRVLGVEYFGLLAFATATITYFTILTDYGFNLTAVRDISIHKENQTKIVEIFSSVMSIKFLLMLLSFAVLTLLVFSFEKFSKDWDIYFLTFASVVAQVFFPSWFFQGMQRMKYITLLNIFSRTLFTASIFILVQTQSDYYLVPILNAAGALIAGIYSLYLIKKDFQVMFQMQKIETLKHYLHDGWHVFVSGVFTTVYTVSTIFILGIFSSNEVVGYYALADKVIKAVTNLYKPLEGALYPYISKMVSESKEKALVFIKKVFLLASVGMGLLSLALFFFADKIIYLLSKSGYEESILLLQLLAAFPLVITIAKILSTNYIINFELQHTLSKVYFSSALVSLVLSFSLVPLFEAVGSAIAVMLTEIFATTYLYLIVRKRILRG